ncbi:MAG: DUF4190 domain-containing protein [Phycisphaerae bacterium]|nr:DUF4190 domain-containing protein [Phycisphaerae bacterium]
MTQFNPNPTGGPVGQPPWPPPPPQAQRTSALAILSLVASLLFCIPFAAPAAGLLFGIIALVLISGSRGMVKGKGLAIAGVVVSAVMLFAHVFVTAVFFTVTMPLINIPAKVVESFIYDLQNTEFKLARGHLSKRAADAVTDEQLGDLRDLLAEEYGTIDSVSLDLFGRAFTMGIAQPAGGWNQSQAWQANWGQAGVSGTAPNAINQGPIPIECEFSNGTVFGVMMLAFDPNSQAMPSLLLDSFTLIGDEGPWTFPSEEPDEVEDEGGSEVTD